MDRRLAIRTLTVVLLVVAAIAIGVAAYNIGYSTGFDDARGAAGNAVVPYPYFGRFGHFGYGVGFGFFGLIFPILFFVLIFLLVRAAFWGGGPRYGRWARARWHEGDDDFESWHRRAHGEPSERTETRPDRPGQGGTSGGAI